MRGVSVLVAGLAVTLALVAPASAKSSGGIVIEPQQPHGSQPAATCCTAPNPKPQPPPPHLCHGHDVYNPQTGMCVHPG